MDQGDITPLLEQVQRGNTEAQSQLASAVYNELRRLAAHYMRGERADHTMQPTALVHEAFIRLVAQNDRSWHNRAHFFAAAAQMMRRILIDYARGRRAERRGGGYGKVPFEEALVFSNDNFETWIAVDQALSRLAERDARMARIVELRFFASLTEDEIAETLNISARTVNREWSVAKAWLQGELSHIARNE